MAVWFGFGLIFICAIVFCFYRAFLNTKKVELNHIRLSQDTSDIPGLTVLHISDMHMENISVSPSQLFELLREQPLDLIALTGDYLDQEKSLSKLATYLDVFHKLNPKHGIYVVLGNHDYILDHRSLSELLQLLEAYGCVVMQNENYSLSVEGTRINIIGIDDSSTNRSDVAQAFHGVEEGYQLVLTHDPNIVLSMDDYHFHYLLAGHFHGGQIYWPKPYHLVKMGKQMVRMNMVKGLHRYQGKPFYISAGLGQTGLNIRVGSRPEITFHHLPLQSMANNQGQTPRAV